VQVYFDVDVGGSNAGRITFELRADVTPKTAGTCTLQNLFPFCVSSVEKGLNLDIPRQRRRGKGDDFLWMMRRSASDET
jgi:hypothetical protein